MTDALDAALAAAFPDRSVAGTEAAGPSWNDANRTVRVRFDDDSTAYLKTALDESGRRIRRERAVVEYVDATTTGVAVPDVLAAADDDADDADAAPPYLATAPLSGDPFLRGWDDVDEAERRDRFRALGAGLARVHEHRFERHGTIVGGGAAGLDVDREPWTDVLVDQTAWLRDVSPSERYDDHFDRVATMLRENADRLDPAPAALLHGDPSRPNVFLTDGGVGLLDWEQAVVGDPVRELVRVRDQQLGPVRGTADPDKLAAFHDGYRSMAGSLPPGYEDRRPVYEAVRLLGVSGYFERTAAFVGTDEGEFASWLEDEVDERLRAV